MPLPSLHGILAGKNRQYARNEIAAGLAVGDLSLHPFNLTKSKLIVILMKLVPQSTRNVLW